MKVYLLDRLAMHAALSFGEPGKDLLGEILDSPLQLRLVDDLKNVTQVPVLVFMLSLHARMGRTNAGTIYGNEIDFIAAHAQQRELFLQRRGVGAGTDQGAKDHVATGAGKTVEVDSFHK